MAQPRDGDAEGRQDHDVVGADMVERLARVGQEPDAQRPELVVHVRVVDDLAGQVDRPIGKARPRLVGVVHGAIDAVAEPELLREVQLEAAGPVLIPIRLDRGDQAAVVVLGQLAGDGLLEVEALPEDQWWHGPSIIQAAPARPEARPHVEYRHACPLSKRSSASRSTRSC
jgi:hypothetical protein